MEFLLSAGVESGALKADQQELQRCADANLGVDCSGFVIAYLVEIGVLQWNAILNGGTSCFWIYENIAKKNWRSNKYADQPELWDLDAIQEDDIILWMKSGGGPETKAPGHISVVVDVGDSGVECAESSGARQLGPKHTVRKLQRSAEEVALSDRVAKCRLEEVLRLAA
jgi:hypothetical protein